MANGLTAAGARFIAQILASRLARPCSHSIINCPRSIASHFRLQREDEKSYFPTKSKLVKRLEEEKHQA